MKKTKSQYIVNMGSINLKVGDFVCCDYSYNTGVGYGKVLKITDIKTKNEFQSYENIITGWGDKNTKLAIMVQIVGYDFDSDHTLSTIVEINEERLMDPHSIYRILNEQDISNLKNSWESTMRTKLEFFYQHVNKEPLEGRKTIPNMKF